MKERCRKQRREGVSASKNKVAEMMKEAAAGG
jgi:hypothetical protein